MKERDHIEDLGVYGRIKLKGIFEEEDGDMDCIDLAENRERWRTLVNAVMNSRFP
jgi:hypothetical protein